MTLKNFLTTFRDPASSLMSEFFFGKFLEKNLETFSEKRNKYNYGVGR